MGANRHLLALLLTTLFTTWLSGCAHTADTDAPQQQQEMTLLRERVRLLERRVSDLDAQLDAVAKKVARQEGPRPQRRYSGGNGSVSSDSVSSDSMSSDDYGVEEAPQRRRRKIGLGADAIDLPPKPLPPQLERSTVYDVPPSHSVSSDSVSSGSVSSDSVSSSDPRSLYAADPGAVSSSPPPDPAPARTGPPAGVSAQELYDWSLARLNADDYLPAIAGFEDVLEQYGEHHLADNALYWTAIAHVRRGETRLGINVWRSLPMRFPGSPKMPDSLYGMAQAHETLGEKDIAETLYRQLIQQYPKAEKAADAKRALSRLR